MLFRSPANRSSKLTEIIGDMTGKYSSALDTPTTAPEYAPAVGNASAAYMGKTAERGAVEGDRASRLNSLMANVQAPAQLRQGEAISALRSGSDLVEAGASSRNLANALSLEAGAVAENPFLKYGGQILQLAGPMAYQSGVNARLNKQMGNILSPGSS